MAPFARVSCLAEGTLIPRARDCHPPEGFLPFDVLSASAGAGATSTEVEASIGSPNGER